MFLVFCSLARERKLWPWVSANLKEDFFFLCGFMSKRNRERGGRGGGNFVFGFI